MTGTSMNCEKCGNALYPHECFPPTGVGNYSAFVNLRLVPDDELADWQKKPQNALSGKQEEKE